jgi:hypothetical protein
MRAFSIILLSALFLYTCTDSAKETPAPAGEKSLRYVIVKWKEGHTPANAGEITADQSQQGIFLQGMMVREWQPLMRGNRPQTPGGMERIGRLYYEADISEQEVVRKLQNSGFVEYAEVEQQVNTKQE